jgi:hypothetical protein
VPELPAAPAIPLVPDVPSVPDVPEDPLEPEVPDEPDVLEEPLEPDVPLEPSIPDVPDVPELPLLEVPDVPDVPWEPATPSIRVTSIPADPSIVASIPVVPAITTSTPLDPAIAVEMATPVVMVAPIAVSEPNVTSMSLMNSPYAPACFLCCCSGGPCRPRHVIFQIVLSAHDGIDLVLIGGHRDVKIVGSRIDIHRVGRV